MNIKVAHLKIFLATASLALLMSCATSKKSQEYSGGGAFQDEQYIQRQIASIAPSGEAMSPPSFSGRAVAINTSAAAKAPAVNADTSTPAHLSARQIIYRADFSVLVVSSERAITEFTESVTKLGGYLSQRQDDTLTLRIPAQHFQSVINSVEKYGAIASQSISSDDVSDAYYDLKLRIENAKNARSRLLVLLAKAEKTEDLLKIEQEVTRITEIIETLEGRLRRLSDQIAFSTLKIRFFQNSVEPVAVNKRKRSRFEWINLVGVEHALQNY